MTAKIRQINWIVVHCTATPQTTKPSSILNYWRNRLGWRSPGYHLLIEADGTVHELAPFDKITNGVRGHNSEAIHISYIGGVDADGLPADTRTEAQKAAILDCLRKALLWTMDQQVKVPHIVGHRDLFNGKACPSYNARREYSWLTVQGRNEYV
jgi:N-acetylmuramoyl-L-alanine amidase